jgi:hypothetical protein
MAGGSGTGPGGDHRYGIGGDLAHHAMKAVIARYSNDILFVGM